MSLLRCGSQTREDTLYELECFAVIAVLSTAVAMAAGFAHLLELPNKMPLAREDYLTVQQIYRGWALLGVVVLGALVTTGLVAVLVRARRSEFYLTLAAALCIALSLVIFFLFTYPANQQTRNWTTLPENWETLRRQWEYSLAVGAGLYFVALSTLTLATCGSQVTGLPGKGSSSAQPNSRMQPTGRGGARGPSGCEPPSGQVMEVVCSRFTSREPDAHGSHHETR